MTGMTTHTHTHTHTHLLLYFLPVTLYFCMDVYTLYTIIVYLFNAAAMDVY
jgi:hypothetical protein